MGENLFKTVEKIFFPKMARKPTLKFNKEILENEKHKGIS